MLKKTMKKTKLFIKNRKNQKICVLIEKPKNPIGLAFVMHGLGGFKEQPHIEILAKAFKDNNYTVVRFDTINSFGESDGNYENATTTNYHEDLEDVIKWSKKQKFYKEPFVLAGHSLGGISTTLYAQKYPKKVKAIAPISTVISGKLSLQSPKYKNVDFKKWKKVGSTQYKSTSGKVKKAKWSHFQDRLRYNLLKRIDRLKMPVLLIVGTKDNSTPLKHQKILFNKLPCDKELYIIENAPHTFKNKKHLDQIYRIMNKWIKKL